MTSTSLVLFVAFVLQSLCTEGLKLRKEECFRKFDDPTYRGKLVSCTRNEPCFLVKREEFFVFNLNNSYNNDIFPCSNLDGFSVKVLEEIRKESSLPQLKCIDVTECTFDDMINILNDVENSKRNTSFIVGNIMFVLPERISDQAVPSTSFLAVKLSIVGRSLSTIPSIKQACHDIFDALDFASWVIVVLSLLILLVVRIGITACLETTRTKKEFIYKFFGCKTAGSLEDSDKNETIPLTGESTKSELRNETVIWNSIWKWCFEMFFRIFFLFYGLASFYYVFNLPPAYKDLQRIKNVEEYATLKGSATEYLFNNSLAIENRSKNWHRFHSYSKMFNDFKDNKFGVKYMVSYEPIVWLEIDKQGLCSETHVYDTRPRTMYNTPSHSNFLFGGFYYGRSVSGQLRTKMNRAISKLVVSEKVDNILSSDAIPKNCGREPKKVNWFVLLIPIMAVIGPLVGVFGCYAAIRKVYNF